MKNSKVKQEKKTHTRTQGDRLKIKVSSWNGMKIKEWEYEWTGYNDIGRKTRTVVMI